MKKKVLIAAVMAGLCAGASAGTIVSASTATINAGGQGYGLIANTYNQNGLSVGYISGVTDFATYLAGPVVHTTVFQGNEWFSNLGTTLASVTYDLGVILNLSGMALWNEESSGISSLNLLYSSDGMNFKLLSSGLSPVQNTRNASYRAETFSFGAVDARYIRLDMSNCPKPGSSTTFCAIGEVAFEAVAPTGEVPEPASLALFGLGLAGLAVLRRRR